MFSSPEIKAIAYKPAIEYFQEFSEGVAGFLLESVDIAQIYGRVSVFSIDPPVEVIGYANEVIIRALNHYGHAILQAIDVSHVEHAEVTKQAVEEIRIAIDTEKISEVGRDEASRFQQANAASILRVIMQRLSANDAYAGLYGAFSYDFVREFEHLPKPDYDVVADTPDFHVYIPDIIYVIDHLKERAEIRYYNINHVELPVRMQAISRKAAEPSFRVGEVTSPVDSEQFIASVEQAKEYMRKGDIFEIVLSRPFSADFSGSTLALYQRYREHNPSPYMFYYRFGNGRTLLGASPEMFVRVENNIVMTRPISGTAKRSDNAIEDYQHMMELLNSAKEKSELDMLIDLARNDISRVCLPGVEVHDYRFVEKYSRVMHTIAHVEGRLDADRYTAFDAFAACLNAGTLTGAPKIRAMQLIDELEQTPRGYYGGNVGYVTFNNELNTGIIIRSAEIQHTATGATITTQAGASIVLDSDPAAEFAETEHKSQALREVLADA